MKMFGTFLLMSLLSLPLFVQAEAMCFGAQLFFAPPVKYVDESALVEKECLAVVYVFNVEDLTSSSLPPFTIDAAGQLKATSLTADVRWGKISTHDRKSFDTVGTVAGVPKNQYMKDGVSVSGLHTFSSLLLDTDFQGTVPLSATAYLVVMDTRFGDKTCKGAPKYIATYGVSYLGKVSQYGMGGFASFAVGEKNDFATIASMPMLSYVLMPFLSCKPVPMVEWSYNGQTHSGGELETLLTPMLSTMVSTADGMELLLSTGADAPILYTLQTKVALSEPWVNFETIAEKKLFANFQQGGYTRFQIEGQKVLSIPRMADDTTRFYRVVGE